MVNVGNAALIHMVPMDLPAQVAQQVQLAARVRLLHLLAHVERIITVSMVSVRLAKLAQ